MPPTLLSAWHDTLRASPAAPALIEAAEGRIWTRAELDVAAEAWRASAGDLTSRLVTFAEANTAQWFVVFLGILKAGGIAAPLDPGEPLPNQHALARRLRAAFRWNGARLEPLTNAARFCDDRRLIKLTSGSTGAPRALPFTDAQMLADGHQVCAAMDIASLDINYALIPFGHSYGLGNLVIPLLAQGTALVCGSAALPHVICAEIARWRATVFPAVPVLLRSLAASDADPASLDSLRTVISAGAPLEPQTARAFHAKFARNVHSFYGSSETGGIAYDRTGTAAREGRGVGTPLPGVQIALTRDRRVRVTSPAVYTIGNPRRRDALGTNVTADFAELNSAGELVLLGRAGRVVKIAGRRLDLAEVERALRSIPGVRDAYALPHPERAETLAALVACDHPVGHVRERLRERLPSWKIPRRLIALPAFPVTARGKTDTAQLRQLVATPAPRPSSA